MAKKSNGTTSSRSVRTARISRAEEEFNPDYSEIKSDLRRIGLLASMFLAILIVLSFVL